MKLHIKILPAATFSVIFLQKSLRKGMFNESVMSFIILQSKHDALLKYLEVGVTKG